MQKYLISDLFEMRNVAKVFAHGKFAGTIWEKPYQADITLLVRAGENELKIEVVNLWINRLTGVLNLPVNERFTKTNISSKGSTPDIPAESRHVEPYGLNRPVRLLPSESFTVNIQL